MKMHKQETLFLDKNDFLHFPYTFSEYLREDVLVVSINGRKPKYMVSIPDRMLKLYIWRRKSSACWEKGISIDLSCLMGGRWIENTIEPLTRYEESSAGHVVRMDDR